MAEVKLEDRTQGLSCDGAGLIAARQSGLYRIADDGRVRNLYQSWLPDQAVPTMAVAVGGSGEHLLAGIPGGVARSDDGGENWEALQFRVPPPLVTCLTLSANFDRDGCALAGTFEDGIYRSSDGGRSWRAHNHGLFDHSVFCLARAAGSASDGMIFAGTSSGIYKSENGGRLWRDLVMPSGDETVLSLALSPDFAADGTIYAGCESQGLMCSRDGGENWERALATDGAVNAVVIDAVARLVAQVDDGVLVSGDGGATWTELVAAEVDCLTLDADGTTLWLALADGSFRRETI